MKTHTTNYRNTLIEIAEDSPVARGTEPPANPERPSVARQQFEMLAGNPYRYDSDSVLFGVYALRKDIPEPERERERQVYFSKGQPCFRASPLTKRYGWGVHSDADGKVALYGAETETYLKLQQDPAVTKVKAMRSAR